MATPSGREVARHQRLRRIDFDDPSVIDDRHAIAQPLGLFHRVRRHERPSCRDRGCRARAPRWRAAPADRVRSSARRGTTTSGSLISASAMNSRCCWPPDSVMNQASRFRRKAQLLEQRVAVPTGLSYSDVQRSIASTHGDPLLELRLTAAARRCGAAARADPAPDRARAPRSNRGPAAGRPRRIPMRRRLAGAVWPDQAEDFAAPHIERHAVHRHVRRPYALANAVDADHRFDHGSADNLTNLRTVTIR